MAQELDVREIYTLLESGEGWARVNRGNVDELITISREKQNTKLEVVLTTLRVNWDASDAESAPEPLEPPTTGRSAACSGGD